MEFMDKVYLVLENEAKNFVNPVIIHLDLTPMEIDKECDQEDDNINMMTNMELNNKEEYVDPISKQKMTKEDEKKKKNISTTKMLSMLAM